MMPKKLEKSLMTRAAKIGLKGERKDAYVYGTLAKVKAATEKRSEAGVFFTLSAWTVESCLLYPAQGLIWL